MQQDVSPRVAELRYAAPALAIAFLGMLFSAASGSYVGWHSPGDFTILVMQAFMVYSAPYIILATAGFAAYHISKLKRLALLYAVSTTILSGTSISVTLFAVNNGGNLVKQLQAANTKSFIAGMVIAVLLSVILIIAAKLIRPRKPRQKNEDDFLPF